MSKQQNILIIEDEEVLREVLDDRLGSEGFNTLTAEDGKQGLEIALEKKPDLILLDLMMPVMDGETMLKKLRQDNWGKNAKVIILTNVNQVEKLGELINKGIIENGVSDYLVKSNWKLDEIVETIKEKIVN